MDKSNQVCFNGHYFQSNVKPKEVLGILFTAIPNLNCWSYEALKELYVEGIKLVSDVVGKVSGAQKLIFYLPFTRKGMLARIYETILASEKLSTLPGFGLSNSFGDKLKGNPEIHSIYKKGN